MFVITGANGFIGSAMVRELNGRGISNVLAVDVVNPSLRPEPLTRAELSRYIATPDFLRELNSGAITNIQGLFHMGAISSTTETDWSKLVENNIDLSRQLFTWCRENDVPYIYASSGAVYGIGDQGFNDRLPAHDLHPLNLYGRSKKEFDIWAEQQDPSPSRWVGLRFFNVYGPNEYHKGPMASVAYKAFRQIKETGRLQLFRSQNPDYLDGMQLRDFVYVKDITRWMWEIYENAKFPSGIYNLGYGQARTWIDLAKSVFQSMRRDLCIDWIDMPPSLAGQYQYFTEADMTKSRESGLSSARYSLESGVTDYLQNYLLSSDPYL